MPRPTDTGSGEILESATQGQQAKTEGESRRRCIGTWNETQDMTGRDGRRGSRRNTKGGEGDNESKRRDGKQKRKAAATNDKGNGASYEKRIPRKLLK